MVVQVGESGFLSISKPRANIIKSEGRRTDPNKKKGKVAVPCYDLSFCVVTKR